ncbi:MAG: PRC-barrel domain-containing protein [Sedimentisphaerales bacterium]|nr:PRC-barrel domain-containing protein [Sedimentisphaerales bacterium]
MYRTFTSAMRIGCLAAMMMFLAAPTTSGETHEHTGTMMGSDQSMTSPMGSESMEGHAKSTSMTALKPTYQRCDHVIGKRVVDNRGDKLGTIEDLVLNAENDSVSYAVLSYGGFLGFGDKLFAVPWSELQTCPKTGAFALDVRKEYLKDAPGFPKDQWPNMADKNWAQRIETFYRQGRHMSAQAHREPSSGQAMMTTATERLPIKYRRATCLIGLPAKDYQGEQLGALDDIVIDPGDGKVVYGVVILETTPWALDRQLAVVPWNSVQVVPELAALRLDADESMLDDVAFARGDGFPYLGDPEYAQGIETRFEATPYWETLGYVPGEGPMTETMKPSKSAKPVEVSAWRPGSEYNQRFDPGLVTTVRGTIESIGTFSLARHSVQGLRLGIKTAEGKTCTVHAGPRPFIESQGVTLHFGDEVTVTGAPTRIGWRGEILLASTIQAGGQTFRLRAADGTPQWNAGLLTAGGSSNP